MTKSLARRSRQRIAGFLAAVATVGFAVAPVLHAEVHLAEARQGDRARAAAFERVFALVFSGKRHSGTAVQLSRALAQILGERQGEQPIGEREGHHHHGGQPPRSRGLGSHGTGSLQHLGVALHVSPPAPIVLPHQRVEQKSLVLRSQPIGCDRFLLVEESQGPPAA